MVTIKIADKFYEVGPAADGAPMVSMAVKVWGITMAQEEVTPDQARKLARALDAAADVVEGRAL